MLKAGSRRIGVGVFSSATLFALSALAIPATALAQGAPPTVTPAPAEASGAGGPGESCRARTDCAAGLKCVSNACHDEMEGASCTARTDCGGKLACVGEKCVVSGAAAATNGNGGNGNGGNGNGGNGNGGNGSGGNANGGNGGNANGGNGSGGDSKKWKGFEGVRPFVGLTLGGGPTLFGSSLGTTTQGGFLFALKGGVLIDRIELGAEISPVTFLPYTGVGGKPTLQVNLYGGYHIPLAGPVSWPLRAGIGILAVNTFGDLVYFEGRLDLIGISALVGPVLLDLHVPSFRIFANDKAYGLHFMFGIGGAILPDAF